MAPNNPANTIVQFWKGHVAGTNRGPVTARTKQEGDTFHAKAIIEDQAFGTSIVSYSGKMVGRRAELRLVDFRGLAPAVPLDGQLTLDIDENSLSAEGSWQSDIGTSGTCKVHAIPFSAPRWWSHLAAIKVGLFLRRRAALLYATFLLSIAILGLSKVVEVSYADLVLLLIPAPYIFRIYLAELIRAYRVRRIGLIELEAQNPLTEDIRGVIAQQVQEAVAFLALDGFFVLRSKLVLIWLAQNQTADRGQFNAYASAIGVPADNLDVTWNALIASGCAMLDSGRLAITDLGRRYVARLIDHGRPARL